MCLAPSGQRAWNPVQAGPRPFLPSSPQMGLPVWGGHLSCPLPLLLQGPPVPWQGQLRETDWPEVFFSLGGTVIGWRQQSLLLLLVSWGSEGPETSLRSVLPWHPCPPPIIPTNSPQAPRLCSPSQGYVSSSRISVFPSLLCRAPGWE